MSARWMSLRKRLNACAGLALVPVLPIGARLAHLHVLEGRSLSQRADRELTRIKERAPLRGRILDARGRVLAESLPAWSAFADPARGKHPASAAARLAPFLQIPEDELRDRLKGKRRFVWLKRKLDLELAEKLRSLDIPGIGLVLEEERHYPNGPLARNVLGAVGTDGEGLSGLERLLDRELDGENRRMRLLVDGTGVPVRTDEEEGYRPPRNIQLTLDATVQYFAEEALTEAIQRFRAESGMAIVQDPRSGDVLAMASLPVTPFKNPPVQQVFEPGSTLKFLAALAAVEEEVLKPGEQIRCEGGEWEPFPGVVIRDHEGFERLDLPGILRHSSNIGIAKVAQRLGVRTFHDYARRFGLGLKTGIGFPAEPSGILHDPRQMRPVNLVTASYGYGVSVSAVQLTAAYSALANGGRLMQPRLVLAVKDEGGRPVREDPPVEVRRVASEASVLSVRTMLTDVVRDGTGVKAGVAGYSVAGKTGTARRLDPETRKYSTQDYMASFAGFVPQDDPAFTILVVLDKPQAAYYASQVAAPVFADIARRVLSYQGTPKDAAPAGPAAPARAAAK